MNRATRRRAAQGKNTARIPEHTLRHIQRTEFGYTPGIIASTGMHPIPPETVQEHAQAAQAAWQALSTGQPLSKEEQATHWKRLAAVCNITRARARAIQAANAQQAGSDDMAILLITLSNAQDALQAMQVRGEFGGSYTPTAQGLQIIPDMLDVYEQILSLSTSLQMQRAVEEVYKLQAEIAGLKK